MSFNRQTSSLGFSLLKKLSSSPTNLYRANGIISKIKKKIHINTRLLTVMCRSRCRFTKFWGQIKIGQIIGFIQRLLFNECTRN